MAYEAARSCAQPKKIHSLQTQQLQDFEATCGLK